MVNIAPALESEGGTVVTQEIGIQCLQQQRSFEPSDVALRSRARARHRWRLGMGCLQPQRQCQYDLRARTLQGFAPSQGKWSMRVDYSAPRGIQPIPLRQQHNLIR